MIVFFCQACVISDRNRAFVSIPDTRVRTRVYQGSLYWPSGLVASILYGVLCTPQEASEGRQGARFAIYQVFAEERRKIPLNLLGPQSRFWDKLLGI